MRLRYSVKAYRPVCILEREREHIGSRWSRVIHLSCTPASYYSKSCMSSSWRFSKSSMHNGSDRKQATQENK
jgi:hypothetical protein